MAYPAPTDPTNSLPLAVTMGEAAGIGPDIILKTHMERDTLGLPPIIVFGCAASFRMRARTLGVTIDIGSYASPEVALAGNAQELRIVDMPVTTPDCCGDLRPENGSATISAIEKAVSAVMDGRCCALVTGPIHKKNLYQTGFAYPGHTEYLAALAYKHTRKTVLPVMMIASDLLRTVPVTIHIPLAEVLGTLTEELLEETVRITAADLQRRFGIPDPRLAIAGINPHAGEGGAIGREEQDLIAPVIDRLQREGLTVFGPLSADTMFHAEARKTYDVAICMYHDQALIPAKTLAFDDGVNVTLGLPFIRTSPDHGTALDIAGKNIAKPNSYIAALRMAHNMALQSTGPTA